ncbi:MAG: hypothetical protein MJZ31_12385 [Bacteroidales bacterium]|nr:hypothetical protein [Bacteroidales bacterium]
MKTLLNKPPYFLHTFNFVGVTLILSLILKVILTEIGVDMYILGPKIWELHVLPTAISIVFSYYYFLWRYLTIMYIDNNTIIICYPARFVSKKLSIDMYDIEKIDLIFYSNETDYRVYYKKGKNRDYVNVSIGDNKKIKDTLRLFRDLGISIDVRGDKYEKQKYMP